jgi:hypothetical protein
MFLYYFFTLKIEATLLMINRTITTATINKMISGVPMLLLVKGLNFVLTEFTFKYQKTIL